MGLDVMVYKGPLTRLEVDRDSDRRRRRTPPRTASSTPSAPTGRRAPSAPVPGSEGEFWDRVYENGWLLASDHNGFGRLGSLEAGMVYATTSRRSFRAGSYSTFGRYREELCERVLGVEPQAVWNAPALFADRPFYEQISFGDNQDTIGPEVCAELAHDYETHRRLAEAVGGWFAERYATWLAAFREAGGSGGAIHYG